MKRRTKLIVRLEALEDSTAAARPIDREEVRRTNAQWRAEGLSENEIDRRHMDQFRLLWLGQGFSTYSIALQDSIRVPHVVSDNYTSPPDDD